MSNAWNMSKLGSGRERLSLRAMLMVVAATGLASCSQRDDSLKPLDVFRQPGAIPDVKVVNVEVRNYCPEAGTRFSDVFFTNMSLVVKDGSLQPDWDRDGIPNALDTNLDYGFDYRKEDSNADGYHDLSVWVSNMKSVDQERLRVCEVTTQDTDHDRLTDCEEDVILKTNSQNFDSDGDGIPDYLELRAGMNPLDVNDAFGDKDGDGVLNMDEVRQNMPVDETNTTAFSSYAVRVLTGHEATMAPNGGTCMWIRAENIPVMNVSNGNLIRANLVEMRGSGTRILKVLGVIVPQAVENKKLIVVQYPEVLEQ